VGLRAGLDAVVKRKIPSPYRDSNPPIIQPVAQCDTTELSWLLSILKGRQFKSEMNVVKVWIPVFSLPPQIPASDSQTQYKSLLHALTKLELFGLGVTCRQSSKETPIVISKPPSSSISGGPTPVSLLHCLSV
jgi:hypothetical protein